VQLSASLAPFGHTHSSQARKASRTLNKQISGRQVNRGCHPDKRGDGMHTSAAYTEVHRDHSGVHVYSVSTAIEAND